MEKHKMWLMNDNNKGEVSNASGGGKEIGVLKKQFCNNKYRLAKCNIAMQF